MIGLWLAQNNSGNSTDFIRLILPLLAMTGFFFIMWIGLTMLIMQRAAERRRRQREGLEPLPSFYAQGWSWLKKQFEAPNKPKTSTATPSSDDLLPDVDQLLSDLPLAPSGDDLVSVIPDPPKPPMPAKAETSVSKNIPLPASNEDGVEVLRVLRDLDSGQLIIDLRGQLFTHIDQITDEKARRRFENLVVELLQLVDEEQLRKRFAPKQTAVVVQPAPPAPPPPVAPAYTPPPPAPAATGLTIADQIESLLQRRLVTHPELASRQIHIHPDAFGGVQIEVDGQFYEAVSDVSDQAVRSFLQKIMQEWSEQQ